MSEEKVLLKMETALKNREEQLKALQERLHEHVGAACLAGLAHLHRSADLFVQWSINFALDVQIPGLFSC